MASVKSCDKNSSVYPKAIKSKVTETCQMNLLIGKHATQSLSFSGNLSFTMSDIYCDSVGTIAKVLQ